MDILPPLITMMSLDGRVESFASIIEGQSRDTVTDLTLRSA